MVSDGQMLDEDQNVGSKYYDSVSLSVGLCESVPDQFKLIETPINSFLLVTNVMPTDTRPWSSQLPDGMDFSGIHLPRLKKLNSLTQFEVKERKEDEHLPQLPPSDIHLHYTVYDSWAWQRALKINKDEVIQEAIEHLSKPVNWKGVAVDDPLPLMWLLFYGKMSFCVNIECLYNNKFNHPGPILWPQFMYKPTENVQSFISGVCKYVKFLYGCNFKRDDLLLEKVPFDESRFSEALEKLKFIEDCGTYVSRTCLPCKLYHQNLVSRRDISSTEASIILGGSGKKYITPNTGSRRCLDFGDIVLYPSYDIPRILDEVETYGIF